MPELLPSFRRLYLCVVIVFLIGTTCALNNQPQWLYSSEGLIFTALCVLYLSTRSLRFKISPIHCLLILLTPVAAFYYTRVRISLVQVPLQNYCDRSAILLGKLTEKLPGKSLDSDNYTVAVEKILFPDRHTMHLKTQINIHHSVTQSPDSLPLMKWLLFKVSVRKQTDSQHMPYKLSNDEHEGDTAVAEKHVFLTCSTKDVTIYSVSYKTPDGSATQNLIDKIQLLIDESRKAIATAHVSALSNEQGSLLASMVLGDKAIKLPDEIIHDFRAVGLSHIVAASGFNLTLVISMSFFIAGSLVRSEKKRAFITLTIMVCFVLLAGLSASIVRSAIMCTVIISSRLCKRKSQLTSTLATAILLTLLYDPLAIQDLGLQLSYAATLGITCGAQPMSDLLQVSPSRIGRAASEIASTCLIAQLSVLPLQVFSFWNANVLFLISNDMVLPLVGPITTVGFASSLVALIVLVMPQLATYSQFVCNTIDAVLGLPLNYVLLLTHTLASLHWAQLHVGKPILIQVLFYYMCFLLFLIAMRRQWHRAIILILPLLGVWILLLRPQATDLTLGVLRSGLIIVNSERDAAVFPSDDSADKNRDIEKFLNFAAVHDSLDAEEKNSSAPQRLRLNSIDVTKLKDSCYVYTDSSHRLGVVYAPSVENLKSTLAASNQCLGLLRQTDQRTLVLRLDLQSKSLNKYKPETICSDAVKLMSACGIEKAVFTLKDRQFSQFAAILQTLRRDKVNSAATTTIIAQKSLQAFTLTKTQLQVIQKTWSE